MCRLLTKTGDSGSSDKKSSVRKGSMVVLMFQVRCSSRYWFGVWGWPYISHGSHWLEHKDLLDCSYRVIRSNHQWVNAHCDWLVWLIACWNDWRVSELQFHALIQNGMWTVLVQVMIPSQTTKQLSDFQWLKQSKDSRTCPSKTHFKKEWKHPPNRGLHANLTRTEQMLS